MFSHDDHTAAVTGESMRARCGIALMFLAGPAFASLNRTAVSINGVDTNPCSVTAPCRSFSAALAQTSAGGEVIALTSAGYGALSINQPVTLLAPEGIYAGLTSAAIDQHSAGPIVTAVRS